MATPVRPIECDSPVAGRAALLVSIVLLIPLLSGLTMSLQPEGRTAMAYWWSGSRGWLLLFRTLCFAAVGATIATAAGLGLALTAGKTALSGRWMFALACLPLLLPSSLIGAGWIMALGRDAVISNVLRNVLGEATPTIYDFVPAAAATGMRYFGVAALIFSAVLYFRQDTAAEQVFGLRWPQRMRLLIGQLSAALPAVWLLLVLLIQSDHVLPGMFLQHTFGTEVLIQFNALFNPAGAAALASVPALIALGASVFLLHLFGRRQNRFVSTSGSRSWAATRVAWWKRVIGIAIVALTVGVPVSGILLRSGGTGGLIEAMKSSRDELLHSAWLAGAGGVTSVALAWILAAGWLRGRAGPLLRVTSPLLLLNVAIPGSLLALGVLAIAAPPVLDSEIPLIAAYGARVAPIVAILLLMGWARIDPLARVAARIHNVSLAGRVVLELPQRAPAALAGLWLGAMLIAAELEMSLILVRPGATTLGVRLYTMIHTAPDQLVASLASFVLVLVSAAALVGAGFIGMVGRKVHQ